MLRPLGLRRFAPLLWLAAVAACGGDPGAMPADRELPALTERPAHRTCLAGLPDTPPARLSDTDCFESLGPLEPASDLIPYEVISPLWTAGAAKHRYIALPPDAHIGLTLEGAWELPVGTVLVKVFALRLTERGGAEHPVEVRFMIRRERGWDFYSYEVDEDGQDGTLLATDQVVDYRVETAEGPLDIEYVYPSRTACTYCHGDGVGAALGPQTRQANLRVRYGNEVRNQIEALSDLGLFEEAVADASSLPSMPDPSDESAPVAERARSYLHANCAHCHQPGGWMSPDIDMDLRWDRSLDETRSCGVPVVFAFDPSSELRIAPGEPEASSLWQRMRGEGLGARAPMPPLRSLADPTGVDVVRRWIESMDGCPEPAD